MFHGQHRVHRQHPGTGPTHHRADLLPHGGLVAVHFAGRTEGLGLHERAFVNAGQCVVLQFLTGRAQLPFGCFVLFAAVKRDHLAHQQFFVGTFFV